MRSRPATTKNSSSSVSWWCQTKLPLNFTTLTSWPFSSAMTLGLKCSVKVASFSATLILSTLLLSCRRPRRAARRNQAARHRDNRWGEALHRSVSDTKASPDDGTQLDRDGVNVALVAAHGLRHREKRSVLLVAWPTLARQFGADATRPSRR